jgi:hypothetical protein
MDLLFTPYRVDSSSKSNWNLLIVVVLLSQGLIFQNQNESFSNVLVGFIILFVGCFSQQIWNQSRLLQLKRKTGFTRSHISIDKSSMLLRATT